jgi:UbiD family decarboxylase
MRALEVCGQEPAVSIAASTRLGWGMSEYGYAGRLKGKPVEVIEGVTTGLPIPATAEIVLEGELLSPKKELRSEGPFGEWTGHYGRGRFQGKNLVVKVNAIMHRHQPIIEGAPPLLDRRSQLASIIRKSAELWNELDKNIKGVMGV